MENKVQLQGWRNDSRGVGTRPWGLSRKKVLKCLKGPKTTYTTIAIAAKRSKRSEKGPFSLYLGHGIYSLHGMDKIVISCNWSVFGRPGS